ncbi:fibronectin type III-like domain-contianing protein [Oleiharenicola sp. Vm1]|uniref:fibronectin type III-like domain-contianing protein n=1 Tax=Oleiharenicola sp. Vm1 TaxID=3398393 RepID=UPI0039F46D57
MPTTPHYAFGHGLSYTTFHYGEIRLARANVRAGETIAAEVTVTNTGARAGIESVLWFIRDPAASITRPLRDLKHFECAALAPGEARVFRWEIEPGRDFAFPDADGRRVLEPGEIQLFAGGRSVTLTVLA